METSSILTWGVGALVAIIILGILFSKRNDGKKEKMSPPIEVPEKEYSEYNGDEIKQEVVCCDYCGEESTDEYNDKPVCDSCFDKLDKEDDCDEYGNYSEEDKASAREEDDGDYSYSSGSGLNIMSLTIGFIVLSITAIIGITILSTLKDSMHVTNTTSYNSNMTAQSMGVFIESFTAFGDWFGIIIIISVVAIILALVFQAFSRVSIGDI